jgi:aspartate aminotransferase
LSILPKKSQALAKIVVEKDILVVSDEIYEKILYDGAIHRSIASFDRKSFSAVLLVMVLLKLSRMTGWQASVT